MLRRRAAVRGHGARPDSAGHHARPAQLDHDRRGDPRVFGGLRPLPRLGLLDRDLLPGRHGRRPAIGGLFGRSLRPTAALPDGAYTLRSDDDRRRTLVAHRGPSRRTDRAGHLRRRRHPERYGAHPLARSPERRGRAFGNVGAAIAVAAGLGPPIGGILTAALGWRWIFAANVLLLAPALVLGWRLPGDSPAPQTGRFDLRGATL